jgi:pyruvate dehydrogenase E1 component beta subunit/2-oxoisovalerate dehydrogenase E1 component
MVDAVRDALGDALSRDSSVIVYGEDVGVNGGVFRATEGLINEHPDQVFDSPLAEAGIVGLGIGLGACGLTPVPEIQFQSFLYQGFHHLQQHAARMRSRSRSTVTCPMTIRVPYGGGIHALEHHAESFEAGFAHISGVKVVVPSTPSNTKGLLTAAIRDPDPVVFMEPTRLYRSTPEDVPDGEHVVPLGESRTVQEGSDVTLIAWGTMLHKSLDAVKQVNASVEVIDPQTIWPLDMDPIVDSIRKTGRCVVVHEAPKTAGMGADIVARINDHALYSLEAPVERVTGYDVPVPFFAREDAYLPDPTRIAAGIERAHNS